MRLKNRNKKIRKIHIDKSIWKYYITIKDWNKCIIIFSPSKKRYEINADLFTDELVYHYNHYHRAGGTLPGAITPGKIKEYILKFLI